MAMDAQHDQRFHPILPLAMMHQQSRTAAASPAHLKLDELIRSHAPAHNEFMKLEQLSDAELNHMAELLTATRD